MLRPLLAVLAFVVLAAFPALAVDAPATLATPEQKAESVRLIAESLGRFAAAEATSDDGEWKPIYDDGVRLGEAAIAADPTNAEAYWAVFANLGKRAKRSGVTAQLTTVSRLRHLIDTTIELDPKHARGWEARGEMYWKLPWLLGGSTSKGKENLEQAARLAPGWAKPPLRLAEIHADEGEKERAIAEAEKALALADAADEAEYRLEATKLLADLRRPD